MKCVYSRRFAHADVVNYQSTSSGTRQSGTEEINIEMYDLEAGPLAEGSANTNARTSMSLGGFFKEVSWLV